MTCELHAPTASSPGKESTATHRCKTGWAVEDMDMVEKIPCAFRESNPGNLALQPDKNCNEHISWHLIQGLTCIKTLILMSKTCDLVCRHPRRNASLHTLVRVSAATEVKPPNYLPHTWGAALVLVKHCWTHNWQGKSPKRNQVQYHFPIANPWKQNSGLPSNQPPNSLSYGMASKQYPDNLGRAITRHLWRSDVYSCTVNFLTSAYIITYFIASAFINIIIRSYILFTYS
jgi:hypothetical protein